MFQVLLCDDEISVTNFLKNSIPWESLGIPLPTAGKPLLFWRKIR